MVQGLAPDKSGPRPEGQQEGSNTMIHQARNLPLQVFTTILTILSSLIGWCLSTGVGWNMLSSKTSKIERRQIMKRFFSVAIVFFGFLVFDRSSRAQEWLDPAWDYRRLITISNPSDPPVELANYQVQVKLDSSSFDFTKAKSDGGDIRITSEDGTTLIPFWIETWTPSSASIWVKVPLIPTSGTTVFCTTEIQEPPLYLMD